MSHYREEDDYRRSSSRNRDRYRREYDDEVYSDNAGQPPPYMTAAGGNRMPYDQNSPVFSPPPNASASDLGRADRTESLQVPAKRTVRSSSSGRTDLSRRGSERDDRDYDRGYDRDRDYDRDDRADRDDRDGSRSPLEKSKNALDKTFSTSTSGLATGVIGAIVGGFAVREAAEAATRARDKRDGKHHKSKKQDATNDRTALISTLVGAAVGGLSANAIGKRIEHHRHDKEGEGRGRGESRGSRSRSRSRSSKGSKSSKGSRASKHRRSRRDDSDSDSDGSWDSGSNSGRGRHNMRERNLVISRSPSARSASRSQSRNRSDGRKQGPRAPNGGTSDSYYKSAQ